MRIRNGTVSIEETNANNIIIRPPLPNPPVPNYSPGSNVPDTVLTEAQYKNDIGFQTV